MGKSFKSVPPRKVKVPVAPANSKMPSTLKSIAGAKRMPASKAY